MTVTATPSRRPRLLVKVLCFAFAVIGCVIAAVFVLLSWQTKERLTRAVAETMETSQQRFAGMEARRRREQGLQAMTLAENPTLKAAVDTYYSERGGGETIDGQLHSTIQMELAKLQQVMAVPAVSVLDARGTVLASAGPQSGDWPVGAQIHSRVDHTGAPIEILARRGDRWYLTTVVPLVLGRDIVGEFYLAVPLDDAYAAELARESSANIAILLEGQVIASSTAAPLRRAIDGVSLPVSGTVVLDGDEYVVQRLAAVDSARVYALGSVTAAARTATTEAAWMLLIVGAGALVLAAGGSWWLARTVAGPIDALTGSLAQMARARDLTQPLPRLGGSRELDKLAETFDKLRTEVSIAEAESEAVYLGVIGALATALDARDPYTAGHSQRVADLSVSIGRQMQLSENDLETLRLGALLHDIGKIGVSDAILRKPGKLTTEEFDQIKLHPTLGAKILKPLRFLDAQIPIVELHHERPDGRGYPLGLKGDEIPLFARIVHVADAFDAMTSARAYRSGRPIAAAIAELWAQNGVDFDPQVVQAMAALPVALTEPEPGTLVADERQPPISNRSVVQFPRHPANAGQRADYPLRKAE